MYMRKKKQHSVRVWWCTHSCVKVPLVNNWAHDEWCNLSRVLLKCDIIFWSLGKCNVYVPCVGVDNAPHNANY